MKNWKQKLQSFLYGRYGMDALYYALFALWAVTQILYTFTGDWVYFLLSWAFLLYSCFRVFSRNIPRRRRENEWFLKIWNPVRDFFRLTYHRIRDCRSAVYRRCPACRAVLRLPRKKGVHTTNCPRCAHRFDVQIRF